MADRPPMFDPPDKPAFAPPPPPPPQPTKPQQQQYSRPPPPPPTTSQQTANLIPLPQRGEDFFSVSVNDNKPSLLEKTKLVAASALSPLASLVKKSPDTATITAKLTKFYQQHNPQRISNVNEVVSYYTSSGGGGVEALNKDLRQQYGVDLSSIPDPTSAAEDPSPAPSLFAISSPQRSPSPQPQITRTPSPPRAPVRTFSPQPAPTRPLSPAPVPRRTVSPTPPAPVPQPPPPARTFSPQPPPPARTLSPQPPQTATLSPNFSPRRPLTREPPPPPQLKRSGSANPPPARTRAVVDLRVRLEAFYAVHNKLQIADAQKIAEEYADNEKELNKMLKKKYGADLLTPKSNATKPKPNAPKPNTTPRSTPTTPRVVTTPAPTTTTTVTTSSTSGNATQITNSSSPAEVRKALAEFYRVHCPSKVSNVDQIVKYYTSAASSVSELNTDLRREYGADLNSNVANKTLAPSPPAPRSFFRARSQSPPRSQRAQAATTKQQQQQQKRELPTSGSAKAMIAKFSQN